MSRHGAGFCLVSDATQWHMPQNVDSEVVAMSSTEYIRPTDGADEHEAPHAHHDHHGHAHADVEQYAWTDAKR